MTTPSSRKHYFSVVPPATPSSSSQALDSPYVLLLELLRYKVCRSRRGGPRTPSKTTNANLDCTFVKNTLFYTDP